MLKIDPQIRARVFPVLDEQVDQMIETGMLEVEALNAVMMFATERLMDMSPGMIPPEHAAEFNDLILGKDGK